MLVGASLLQGAAQTVTAVYVLTGGVSIWPIVALQALYGLGGGLVTPAETGLIPQTVTRARLQEANAMLGMARNALRVIGPSIAGVIIVAATPGIALAVDAASFFVCAALLALIQVGPLVRETATTFFDDLREGWSEFWLRTWLWASVILIGLANAVFVGGWAVLGPTIAKRRPRWGRVVGDHLGRRWDRRRDRRPDRVSLQAGTPTLRVDRRRHPDGVAARPSRSPCARLAARSGDARRPDRPRGRDHALVHGVPAEHSPGCPVAGQLHDTLGRSS
jgi:hypothetical protein